MLSRTLKPRPCDNPDCRTEFTPQRFGQVACSPLCAIVVSAIRKERKEQRQRKVALRVARKEKREGLEKLKTLGDHCADTQRAVNHYVRVRDFGKGCISCDTGAAQDAGHLFPIGRKYLRSMFRFLVKVIHGQCRQCNRMKGGNVHGYLAGLEKRYGAAYVEECYELKRQADCGELPKLTREMCKQIAAEHRTMAREARAA